MTASEHDSDRLPARVIQIIGVVGVIGWSGFWAVTGRESALMMGTFAAMALLSGGYKKTARALSDLVSRGEEE